MSFAILDGHKVVPTESAAEWADWFETNQAQRTVRRNQVWGSDVSTVFLGLNHGYFGTPMWFETMVFGGPLDGEQKRYTTYDEAVNGHADLAFKLSLFSWWFWAVKAVRYWTVEGD